jgi:hypothetical protein
MPKMLKSPTVKLLAGNGGADRTHVQHSIVLWNVVVFDHA